MNNSGLYTLCPHSRLKESRFLGVGGVGTQWCNYFLIFFSEDSSSHPIVLSKTGTSGTGFVDILDDNGPDIGQFVYAKHFVAFIFHTYPIFPLFCL